MHYCPHSYCTYSSASVFNVRKPIARRPFKKSCVDTTYVPSNERSKGLFVESDMIYVQDLMCPENDVPRGMVSLTIVSIKCVKELLSITGPSLYQNCTIMAERVIQKEHSTNFTVKSLNLIGYSRYRRMFPRVFNFRVKQAAKVEKRTDF